MKMIVYVGLLTEFLIRMKELGLPNADQSSVTKTSAIDGGISETLRRTAWKSHVSNSTSKSVECSCVKFVNKTNAIVLQNIIGNRFHSVAFSNICIGNIEQRF